MKLLWNSKKKKKIQEFEIYQQLYRKTQRQWVGVRESATVQRRYKGFQKKKRKTADGVSKWLSCENINVSKKVGDIYIII